MRITTLLLLASFSHTSFAAGIDGLAPDKLQSHLVFTTPDYFESGKVEVKGYPYFIYTTQNGEKFPGLNYKAPIQAVGQLEEEVYEFEKSVARSVLRTTFTAPFIEKIKHSDGSVTEKVAGFVEGMGSGVVIGRNLVITNRHVLDVAKKNKNLSKCPGGDLTAGFNDKIKVQCQEVLLCGQEDRPLLDESGKPTQYIEMTFGDWCLIRTTPTKSGKEIGDYVDPIKFVQRIEPAHHLQKVATIGNPAGLGIQMSWGTLNNVKALESINLNHFSNRGIESTAFSLTGNSGGALINTDGEMIGLVFAGNRNNLASASSIRTDYIYRELQKHLDPAVLAEINGDYVRAATAEELEEQPVKLPASEVVQSGQDDQPKKSRVIRFGRFSIHF